MNLRRFVNLGCVLTAVALSLGSAVVCPAGQVTFTKMIVAGGQAPGAIGTFEFLGLPSISDGKVAFFGFNSLFQSGVFTTDGTTTNVLADISTTYPGQSVPFLDFVDQPAISNNQVAFVGRFSSTSGDSGIFLAPAGGGALQTLVNGNATDPGGPGAIVPFFAPALSNGTVAFFVSDQLGQRGIFQASTGTVGVVANESTMVPGGSGTFSNFNIHPAISDGAITFNGTDAANQQGIYLAVGNSVSMVANATTTIPGGVGTFVGFGDPSVSGTDVAFVGLGSNNQKGVYASVGGIMRKIADLQTDVPDGSGKFTDFLPNSVAISGSGVAFYASDSSGVTGVYFFDFATGDLTRVIAPGDLLDGREVNFLLNFGTTALDGRDIAFNAIFSDFGPQAIYAAHVDANAIPEPSSFSLALSAAVLMAVGYRLRHARL